MACRCMPHAVDPAWLPRPASLESEREARASRTRRLLLGGFDLAGLPRNAHLTPAADAPPASVRRTPPGTMRRWLVLCLVGLDYFSTLAYLPSIAIEAAAGAPWRSAAGAPLVVGGVVLVTLLAALPARFTCMSSAVRRTAPGARRVCSKTSLHGWVGKLLILVFCSASSAPISSSRARSVGRRRPPAHILHKSGPGSGGRATATTTCAPGAPDLVCKATCSGTAELVLTVCLGADRFRVLGGLACRGFTALAAAA